MLVGTIAVETSEYLSQLLERHGIPHNVLNAKQHAREAEIIKEAGQQGAVTIATNMAGRGVDIKLDDGVLRPRRALRPRHRAPRGAPHRQPAPRPLGPPGRPRRDPLLPLRPGRSRAPVRRRPDLNIMDRFKVPEDQPMEAGDPHEADRERAEEGRGAELRHAQERPQVRRRHEQAAHGDLRAAPRGARGPGPAEEVQAVDRRGRRAHVDQFTPRRTRRAGISTSSCRRWSDLYGPRITADELRAGGRRRPRGADRRLPRGRARRRTRRRSASWGTRHGAAAHARARALRDPPGRRHALARAPREHGLPARGRPPAGHGPEGPARRVHAGGPHHVRGAERAIREEVVFTLFHAELAPEEAAELTPQEAPATTARARSTSTSRWRAPTRSPRRAWRVGELGGSVSTAGATMARSRPARDTGSASSRTGEDRPQRPLLVRVGQEVQEVPRRIAPTIRPRQCARASRFWAKRSVD